MVIVLRNNAFHHVSDTSIKKLRNAEELTNVKRIINNVLEIPEEDFPLDEAPVRIGKFQENKLIYRPLKFKARSFESKKHLLQTSRTNLKDRNNGKYKDLFFKADLTKNQRAEASSPSKSIKI